MSGTIPPIPPPLGTNTVNTGSPNKAVIKCKTAKAMRNGLILAHEGPFDTRDTNIATLRLKFNAFKALKESVDSDSDVEEDLRSSSEFIADLKVEYYERALLENQKRFYKRSKRVGFARKPMARKSEKGLLAELFDWDEESITLEDEETTKVKAFMVIAEEEPSVGKIEKLNEVRVKELRSDNGIEFRNHMLEGFCDEKGISQNFLSPCTLMTSNNI
ncbi:retrovirus-related pol polyprotein from transposon TNT 1-94 [Tanacetum coccineum]